MVMCPDCGLCEEGRAHYCAPRKEFIGDPTFEALMWDVEYGDDNG